VGDFVRGLTGASTAAIAAEQIYRSEAPVEKRRSPLIWVLLVIALIVAAYLLK
jgi:hypothetical protein